MYVLWFLEDTLAQLPNWLFRGRRAEVITNYDVSSRSPSFAGCGLHVVLVPNWKKCVEWKNPWMVRRCWNFHAETFWNRFIWMKKNQPNHCREDAPCNVKTYSHSLDPPRNGGCSILRTMISMFPHWFFRHLMLVYCENMWNHVKTPLAPWLWSGSKTWGFMKRWVDGVNWFDDQDWKWRELKSCRETGA